MEYIESNHGGDRPTQISNILIYLDDGVFPLVARALQNQLEEVVDRRIHNVGIINHEGVTQGDWKQSTLLFILPAGRSRPYHDRLGERGAAQIRQFVENGGRFLGISAGAYYGSARTEFDVGGELEVTKLGTVNFFKGIARGPAYGPGTFVYNSEKGARATPIVFLPPLVEEPVECPIYFNGGPLFVRAGAYKGATVLARYLDLDHETYEATDRQDIIQSEERPEEDGEVQNRIEGRASPLGTNDDGSLEARAEMSRLLRDMTGRHESTVINPDANGAPSGSRHNSTVTLLASGKKPEEYRVLPAAIVSCPVGKGLAVLSAVHFEIDPVILEESDPFVPRLLEVLKPAELLRQSLFKAVLRQLDIRLVDDPAFNSQ